MTTEWLTITTGNLTGFTFSFVGDPTQRIVMQRHTGQLYRLDMTANGMIKTPITQNQYLLGAC